MGLRMTINTLLKVELKSINYRGTLLIRDALFLGKVKGQGLKFIRDIKIIQLILIKTTILFW